MALRLSFMTEEYLMSGSREGIQGSPAVSRGPGGRGVSASLEHCAASAEERRHLC